MDRILKILCGAACAFAFCFLAIGYAAVQDELLVTGSVTIERAVTDICISHEDIDAYSLDPVTGELTIKETYTDSTDNENYRVTGIKENGFVGYSEAANVTSVHIPKTVETIGDNAFTGCSNLKSFTVDSENEYFIAIDQVLFNEVGTNLLRYPACNKYPSPMLYHIPSATSEINAYAFCDLPASTVVVTENTLANSPWGASSPCLILIAPEHYSTIQSFVGDSVSGYTITGDSTVANTNLVFTDLQSNSVNNREWAAVDENGQFTIPSNICNASGPSVISVARVYGDINFSQLKADLADDNHATIGGGKWTPFWSYTDKEIEIEDGYFKNCGFYFCNGSTFTINGGVFEGAAFYYTDGDAKRITCNIKGGIFTSTSPFNSGCVNTDITVYAGIFYMNPSEYTVASSCTFKVAETSSVIDNGDGTWTVVPDANAALVNEDETPTCTCETKCADLNKACEVCKTDITNCGGTEAPTEAEPTCICETKCSELTEACEVCKTGITNCKGTEVPIVEELICSCETKCTELTEACEVCKTDITNCKGTKAPAENDPPADEQGEQPDAGEEQTAPPNDPPADEPSSDDGQSEQPTEDTETTPSSDVSDGEVVETEETQTPDAQNASESEETSEPVISTDPAILPPEGEEDGEEQEFSDDQQGQE